MVTYSPHNRHTERKIRNTIEQFEIEFSLFDNMRLHGPHPLRNEENVVAVA